LAPVFLYQIIRITAICLPESPLFMLKNNPHSGMLRFCRPSTNLLVSLLYIKLARQQPTISATSEKVIQAKRSLNLNEIAVFNPG